MRFFVESDFAKKYPTGSMIHDLKQFRNSFELAEIFNFLGPFSLWASSANLFYVAICGKFFFNAGRIVYF